MDYYNRFGDSDESCVKEKTLVKKILNQILWFIILVLIFAISFSFLQPAVKHSKTDYLAAKNARIRVEQDREDAEVTVEKQKDELVSQGKDLENKNDVLEEQLRKLDKEINSLK